MVVVTQAEVMVVVVRVVELEQEYVVEGVQETVTVLESEPVPPVPVQVAVYVVVRVGEREVVPETALPVEKLVPVQEVAYEEDQVRVELPPLVMDEGDAVRRTTGAGFATVTVYAVQPEALPFTSIAFAWNVFAPEELQECVVDCEVPLFTYPSAGTYSSIELLLSQSTAYRRVSESGSVDWKVYEYEFPCTGDV